MRAYIPDYEMIAPPSLAEALSILEGEPGKWQPFAGGTDLMVLLEAGVLPHRRYISLWSLDELRGIGETSDEVWIGALTTYSEILRNKVLFRDFPMLGQAARETGAVAIQNRGTIGGNIANASPAADTPPCLLAYGAELELISKVGVRRVPYEDFHQGYKKTALRSGELIYRIWLNKSHRVGKGFHFYRKVGTRKAQAISKVCFSGMIEEYQGRVKAVSVGLASVAPVPYRSQTVGSLLVGKALDNSLIQQARTSFAKELSPIQDIRSTAEYRSQVAGNLMELFLRQAHVELDFKN